MERGPGSGVWGLGLSSMTGLFRQALFGGSRGGPEVPKSSASRYFWSGLYKLRGFFHGFMFQYQFLNFSAISWYLRRLYLSEDVGLGPCLCWFMGMVAHQRG